MSTKYDQLLSTVRDYPEFKAQFSSFCETSDKILNDNPHFPGVSFSADSDGTTAKIRMLDQTFVVKFHLVALGDERVGGDARYGVLGAYLPTQGDEEFLLWYTFFDIHGNVRDTPDAASASYSLWDKEFLKKLLGEFTNRYFLHLAKTFK